MTYRAPWVLSLVLLACSASEAETEDGGSGDGAGGNEALPDPCALGTEVGCDAGDKCTIIGPTRDDIGCRTAGPRPAGAYCDADVECATGTFCDPERKVCRTLCTADADCGDNSTCVQSLINPEKETERFYACNVPCNLATTEGCSDAYGATSCKVYRDGDDRITDCTGIGFDDAVAGDECSGSGISCGPGTTCLTPVEGPPGTCVAYCEVAAPDCPAGQTCMEGGEHLLASGVQYGHCR